MANGRRRIKSLKQLTDEADAEDAFCSRDGKWVFYVFLRAGLFLNAHPERGYCRQYPLILPQASSL